MPEAVNARSGPKRARKKSFALEGKNNVRSGDKLFRVYNNVYGGGEDSLLAPLKGVFQYWCFSDGGSRTSISGSCSHSSNCKIVP